MRILHTMDTSGTSGKKGKWIIPVALAAGVILSTAILFSQVGRSPNDDGAIPLVPSDSAQMTNLVEEKTEPTTVATEAAAEAAQVSSHVSGTSQQQTAAPARSTTSARRASTSSTTAGYSTTFVANPSFEASDEIQVWGAETDVEIFRLSYENGEKVVTVNSGNGDEVIAPGTENAYAFQLKNTGNTAMDYVLTMEAYYSSDEWTIPVDVRMKGYDGTWLIGSDTEWKNVLDLNGIEDKATLMVNNYASYELEWQWPFESGDDEWDTLLGNTTLDEDVSLTIVIKTVATSNLDEAYNPQIPKTGDRFNVALYTTLALVSAMMVFLLLKKRKDEASADAKYQAK